MESADLRRVSGSSPEVFRSLSPNPVGLWALELQGYSLSLSSDCFAVASSGGRRRSPATSWYLQLATLPLYVEKIKVGGMAPRPVGCSGAQEGEAGQDVCSEDPRRAQESEGQGPAVS